MNLLSQRKTYAGAFLLSGLTLGGVGILALWTPDLISGTLFKIILTLGVALAASATLFMLSFGSEEDKLTRKMTLVIGICSVAITALLVGQIWFRILEETMLGKLVATLIVICLLAGFVISVWDDFFENKRLKDENYLD